MPHADPIAHGEHVMTVCNACRYCEQFCPVFPAMENRLTFAEADLAYLANLCHNCGECLYACQYAPPHEFGINVPRTMAEIRARFVRGLLLAVFPVERLQTAQPADRPRSGRWTDRCDGRRRSDRQRRCVSPAGWRRRFLRCPSPRRHGRALRRRGPVQCRGCLDRCCPVLARHAGRRGAQSDGCRSGPRAR